MKCRYILKVENIFLATYIRYSIFCVSVRPNLKHFLRVAKCTKLNASSIFNITVRRISSQFSKMQFKYLSKLFNFKVPIRTNYCYLIKSHNKKPKQTLIYYRHSQKAPEIAFWAATFNYLLTTIYMSTHKLKGEKLQYEAGAFFWLRKVWQMSTDKLN